ncbi:fimbrial biogenesis outer membrane usher protein [Erwinia psidii]|uniref:fimbria/pilus outer membrane usher protein n=1 Tax=Erwinia psidii TaxID=69224 RepID=UPI00226B466E|nr:fimbria/pilus outer membrane usher protein [Erwinia psidii]MCX8958285.1 fimbrial biogenesis outer membrane usher protein [Erwinia psidii]
MKRKKPPLVILTKLFLLSFPFFQVAWAEQAAADVQRKENSENRIVKFNTGFLTAFNKDIDLSWLENEKGINPGSYVLEVFLNGKNLKNQRVEFMMKEGEVLPCISQTIMQRITLDNNKMPEGWQDQQCLDLAGTIPGSSANYDYENERLTITIPQIYLIEQPEGYIDPSRWDDGINALTASYSLSASSAHSRKQQNRSMLYGNLLTTLRLGAWRFHTYDSLVAGSQQGQSIQHIQAYAERAVSPLLSELSLGDLSTSGEFFDTTSLRGVILRSDERMLPWTVKGYAPEIRGIAYSNAVVTVKQGGNVIYEQNVPPGEFNISQMASLGYGGNLEVTVTESDGVIRTFQVPYSSIPQLLRKGYFRYSVATGEVRRVGISSTPSMFESTLQYGLNNNITAYGGLQATSDKSYSALNGGVAINTFLGAMSAGVTYSVVPANLKTEKESSLKNNSQLKLSYSKLISDTHTNFNIASYYMAGDNFYTLDEALQTSARQSISDDWHLDRYRNRLEIAVTQDLPENWGQMAISGWWEKNNNTGKNNNRSLYLFSYKNNYDAINYSINVNKTITWKGKEDTAYILNVSMPFGFRKGINRPNLRVSTSYANDNSLFRTSLSGSTQEEDSSLSFNTYFSHSSRNDPNFGINVAQTNNASQKSISYSQSRMNSSIGASINGGVLLHSDGIHFSPYLGETLALIEAEGAEGASIMGNRHSRIKTAGYGLLGNLRPYEVNTLNLDVKGAPVSFETFEEGAEVVPTAGAVVKVKFNNINESSNTFIARIKQGNGDFIPFGSQVFDHENNISGTSGQGGITILSLSVDSEYLEVRWKEDKKAIVCRVTPEELKRNKAQAGEGTSTVTIQCNKDKGS